MGTYDRLQKQGFINVGIDHDTAMFAVESLRRWWKEHGRGGNRDMHTDVAAIRRFMGSLDSGRTYQISRDDPEYMELLKRNNPTEWMKLFSSPVEAAA